MIRWSVILICLTSRQMTGDTTTGLIHWGRQNGCHFTDDTFKHIFFNENIRILIKISLKFVHKGPVNNIPSLVQIMAWRRPGGKPLSEPMMVSLLKHMYVTQPQWVNRIMLTNLWLKHAAFVRFLLLLTFDNQVSTYLCLPQFHQSIYNCWWLTHLEHWDLNKMAGILQKTLWNI